MKKFSFFLAFLIFSLPSAVTADGGLTIGVAANFLVPFKEIVILFEQKTGIRIEGVFNSSGNLFGQIKNGAPYDLFLSADKLRPERLWEKGLAQQPFIYAEGTVVLWTAKKAFCNAGSWHQVLKMQGINRVAIANPETAPYGEAALEALKKSSLEGPLDGKLVFAQNVSQVFQYAHTGAVDAGFCALSSALSEFGQKGCRFTIGEAPPIEQGGCILTRTGKRANAERFAAFITSPEAETIKKKYGYH